MFRVDVTVYSNTQIQKKCQFNILLATVVYSKKKSVPFRYYSKVKERYKYIAYIYIYTVYIAYIYATLLVLEKEKQAT
jgi:hypothetical protein